MTRLKIKVRVKQRPASCCQMLVVLISISTTCNPIQGGNLNLDEITGKVENLKIKNNIGYHFKKKVRQVTQELFISRKMDTTTLLQGIEALSSIANKLNRYCLDIPSRLATVKDKEIRYLNGKPRTGRDRFTYLKNVGSSSFSEANARCQALGKQLPEVYDVNAMGSLVSLMKTYGITKVFAGIEFDARTAMQRFISTGKPMYMGYTGTEVYQGRNLIPLKLLLDNAETTFAYGSDSNMYAVYDESAPSFKKSYGQNSFRDNHSDFTQYIAPVICEERWMGTGGEESNSHSMVIPELNVKVVRVGLANVYAYDNTTSSSSSIDGRLEKERADRLFVQQQTERIEAEIKEMSSVYEYICISIVDHANDTYKNLKFKTENLFAMVDISYHIEQMKHDRKRRRRRVRSLLIRGKRLRLKRGATSFLSKVVFKTGFKAIWGLFGFVQQIRQDIKINKLERQIVTNQRSIESNSQLIKSMASTLQSQSIAVQQLQVLTASLERRIEALENDMKALQSRISSTETRLEIAVKLQLISSLVVRTEQSLREGYNTLESIIHCSVLGQTSPKVLPLSQVEIVQNEVQKTSSADLDTDFSKMQSIVVSDPNDPKLLLVIVNAAAISKSTTDLITMTAIPTYSGSKTVQPVLSYRTIILNQWVGTYVVLTEQEETGCLLHRCYVHGMEQPIHDRTCGIPQYTDKHVDACVYEEVNDDEKSHLIAALPDGAFFSFRASVDAQLFCTDSRIPGTMKKIQGVGVLQLPNGCTLSVTDAKGRNSKLKGPPMHNFIQGQEVVLVENLPLSVVMATANLANRSHSILDQMLEQHLGTMQEELSFTNVKLKHQETAIFSVIASIIATIIVLVIIAYLTYRFSSKVREKIRFILGVLNNVKEKIEKKLPSLGPIETFGKMLVPLPLKVAAATVKRILPEPKRDPKPPPVAPRPKPRAVDHIRNMRKKEIVPEHDWRSLQRDRRQKRNDYSSHTYVSLDRVKGANMRPIYPNVDHLVNELKQIHAKSEAREDELARYNLGHLRKVDCDHYSITAEGSDHSDEIRYSDVQL